MKFIKKDINEALLFKNKTLTLFGDSIKGKIRELVGELQKAKIIIEEPKCNFDVEMAMDIIDDANKVSAIIVFSGDSDLLGPLERLKIKGKKIFVVGVRNMVAEELHKVKDKYIDFGKFYSGKRRYNDMR